MRCLLLFLLVFNGSVIAEDPLKVKQQLNTIDLTQDINLAKLLVDIQTIGFEYEEKYKEASLLKDITIGQRSELILYRALDSFMQGEVDPELTEKFTRMYIENNLAETPTVALGAEFTWFVAMDFNGVSNTLQKLKKEGVELKTYNLDDIDRLNESEATEVVLSQAKKIIDWNESNPQDMRLLINSVDVMGIIKRIETKEKGMDKAKW